MDSLLLWLDRWMPLLTLIGVISTTIALVFLTIDTFADSPSHKRSVLRKLTVQAAFGISLFFMGAASLWFGLGGASAWWTNESHNTEKKKQHIENAKHQHPDSGKPPLAGVIVTEPERNEVQAAPKPAVKQPKTEKPDELDKLTATNREPTLSFIRKTISDAPPFRQKETAQQFVGNLIAWDLEFTSGRVTDNGMAKIFATTTGGWGGLAAFSVNLNQHQFLLDAASGTPLHVDAIIESADTSSVELKDARVRQINPADK